MEVLLGLIGSVLTGGATGLLGVIFQRFADYKNKQLDAQIRTADRAHELAVMSAEWQGKLSVAKEQGEAARDVADSGALAASYQGAFERMANWDMKKEPWYFKMWLILLDVVRGLVRPALTVYLCVLTTLIYFEARALLAAEDLDVTNAVKMQTRIVETILYLTVTCVLWWLGTRNKGKQPG